MSAWLGPRRCARARMLPRALPQPQPQPMRQPMRHLPTLSPPRTPAPTRQAGLWPRICNRTHIAPTHTHSSRISTDITATTRSPPCMLPTVSRAPPRPSSLVRPPTTKTTSWTPSTICPPRSASRLPLPTMTCCHPCLRLCLRLRLRSASSSTSAPLLPSSRSRAISGSSSHALFRPNPSVQYPARSDAAPVILNVRNPPPQPPPQPSSATSSSDSAEKPALDDGAFICDCKDHLHHDNVAFFSGNCPISIGPASPDSIILDSDSDYPGEGDSASHRGENCTVNCAIADADKTAADRLDNIPADMDSDDFDLDLFDDEDLPNGLADAKGPAQGHPLLQDLSVAGSSWLSISDDTLAMSESTLTSKSRPSLLMTATSDFDDSRFSTDSETVGQIDLYARFSDNDASSIFDPNDGKTKMLLLHDSTAHADVAAKDCLQTSATTPLMPVHTPCHDGSFLARLLDRADKPACHINSIDTGDSSVCAHKSDAVANACEAKPDTGGIHNQLGASKGPDSATLLSRHAPLLQEDRHIHPHLHTHNSSANDNEDENEDDFSTATSAALSVSLSVSSSQQSGSSSQPSDTAGLAQLLDPNRSHRHGPIHPTGLASCPTLSPRLSPCLTLSWASLATASAWMPAKTFFWMIARQAPRLITMIPLILRAHCFVISRSPGNTTAARLTTSLVTDLAFRPPPRLIPCFILATLLADISNRLLRSMSRGARQRGPD
ncbi:hypothetical protein BC831DRAFT_49079 [Entophlyctis helioformis]|nr:hypothetical protein BC831DRAFT_49079 [Entophlyctis helioformis]